MSRSFTPPSTLSKDEIRTIADVRRDIWTASFQGLAGGSFAGLAGHALASYGASRQWWKFRTNRNTWMASFFLGGALGSFVMATTTGKNQVHQLHPIFQVGARPPPPAKTYHDALEEARDRSLREETEQLRQNRLYRRATLSNSLQGRGLSDSHGGHWVANEEEDNKKQS